MRNPAEGCDHVPRLIPGVRLHSLSLASSLPANGCWIHRICLAASSSSAPPEHMPGQTRGPPSRLLVLVIRPASRNSSRLHRAACTHNLLGPKYIIGPVGCRLSPIAVTGRGGMYRIYLHLLSCSSTVSANRESRRQRRAAALLRELGSGRGQRGWGLALLLLPNDGRGAPCRNAPAAASPSCLDDFLCFVKKPRPVWLFLQPLFSFDLGSAGSDAAVTSPPSPGTRYAREVQTTFSPQDMMPGQGTEYGYLARHCFPTGCR